MNEQHPDTWLARLGDHQPAPNRPSTEPIFQTAVYDFADLDALEAVWTGQEPGYIYGRFALPNSRSLETAVAQLEAAEAGLAVASGMGAIAAALVGLLGSGARVIAQRGIYGGTASLFAREMSRFGVETGFVAPEQLPCSDQLVPPTRLVLVESLGNPLLTLVDLPTLARRCREQNILLLVDNTLATPWHLQPHRWGADLVVHSATKYLGGHADLTAGVLTGSQSLIDAARSSAIALGLYAAPFDCWLACRGLKTFALRMERHATNALALAHFLSGNPAVEQVYYPGLPGSPDYDRAARLLERGFGPMLSFDLKGGIEAVAALVRHLPTIPLAPSFAGTNTTFSYPARTSHRALSAEERAAAGIGDGLVRLSVGLEHWQDIADELERALSSL